MILRYLSPPEDGPPTGDLHPINSRPCRAYTKPLHPTAATQRFGMNLKRHGLAASGDRQALGFFKGPCMNAPSFTNRNPEAIVAENVYYDSVGYTYRSLSWLEYAKKKSSVCAVFYAALEIRQAIEQLLFEEIVMSVGGQLDPAEYEKAKGSSTKLSKILRRLSPDYDQLVSFTRAVIELEPGAPPLISWDHVKLLKSWGKVSDYLHWGGEPKETVESAGWFVRAIETIEKAASHLWAKMTAGHSGIMMPNQMQPEIRQAWEDYRAGSIDLDSVRGRARLAQPVLVTRRET